MTRRTSIYGAMYAVDLICTNGHRFEAWFANRQAFVQQREAAMIGCSACGSTEIRQAISAVRTVKKNAASAEAAPARRASMLNELKNYVEKHFEDVGTKFADEALKMHLGDADERPIRGSATPDEERELHDEGVRFFKLPDVQ